MPSAFRPQEAPLSCCSARIGFFGMLTLMLLRITVGWHILYEGLWKHEQEEFSSDGYLSMASGPFADFFHYEVMKDFENRKALGVKENHERMDAYHSRFVRQMPLNDEQKAQAKVALEARKEAVASVLTNETNAKFIADNFAAWDELKKQREFKTKHGSAPGYSNQRLWEAEQKLRAESNKWVKDFVEPQQKGLQEDLKMLLPPDQRSRKVTYSIMEHVNARDVDWFVTYSSIAVGFCLMVGLFTRLAALGGGVFLAMIVAAKLQWFGYYTPPAHPAQGHSLFVTKEFIEMMVCFTLATLPVGRWGGLDFIIHSICIRPFFSRGDESRR